MANSTAMAQVNARINQDIKLAGDAVLGQMGISPTQLIRAVWAKVACGTKACDQLVSVLAADPSAGTLVTTNEDDQSPTTHAAWLGTRQQQLAEELGMDLSTFVPHPDDELDDLMNAEFFANEGNA